MSAVLPQLIYNESFADKIHEGGSDSTTPWNVHESAFVVRGEMRNDSVNNSWFWAKPVRGILDIGSNWRAIKSTFKPDNCGILNIVTKSDDFVPVYRKYRGPLVVDEGYLIPPGYFQGLAQDLGSTDHEMDVFGANAFERMRPTNPISDLPTAIGELFVDELPSAIGSSILSQRRISPSLVSGEYLNVTFGIEPLLRDLTKFQYAMNNAQALINKHAELSGKLIRKRWTDPAEATITVKDWDGGNHLTPIKYSEVVGNLHSVGGGSFGTRQDVLTIVKERWTKAAFRFQFPPLGVIGDLASKLQREISEMKYLYGGVNASTIWNLIPYSWAADWFSNAGGVIANLTAFASEGLSMPWGYVMEQLTITESRTVIGAVIGNLADGSDKLPSNITSEVGVVVKRRRKLDPYAIGLDENLSLSGRQWSILAALGFSHGF
jgi:hypothetical protein